MKSPDEANCGSNGGSGTRGQLGSWRPTAEDSPSHVRDRDTQGKHLTATQMCCWDPLCVSVCVKVWRSLLLGIVDVFVLHSHHVTALRRSYVKVTCSPFHWFMTLLDAIFRSEPRGFSSPLRMCVSMCVRVCAQRRETQMESLRLLAIPSVLCFFAQSYYLQLCKGHMISRF